MESNDEREWIAAAKEGDADAFGQLVERYQTPVYNLCYRMLGNHGDAEDAAQEVFLKAYRALKRYDPERPFKTWLLAIASNHSIDQLRRKRFEWVSLDALLGRTDLHPISPESIAQLQFDREEVQAVLEKLGETDRAVVILRYWYELSYDEIAETLSLTNSAVKSRLHRARRELLDSWVANAAQLAKGRNEIVPA